MGETVQFLVDGNIELSQEDRMVFFARWVLSEFLVLILRRILCTLSSTTAVDESRAMKGVIFFI